MSTHSWTDRLGRTYLYEAHDCALIANDDLDLASGAVLALTAASQELGKRRSLDSATGLAAVLFRSESSASSIIEGLDVRPRRILEAEFAEQEDVNDPVAQRIVANLRGLEKALSLNRAARESDLLRWHQTLMAGDPHVASDDVGAFRREQNWIGGDATGPRNAAFVPPHHERLPELLSDLVRFARRDDLGSLVRSFITHAQFEVIHPFTDGNGRVGRMLLQPHPRDGRGHASGAPRSDPNINRLEPGHGSIHRGASGLSVR